MLVFFFLQAKMPVISREFTGRRNYLRRQIDNFTIAPRTTYRLCGRLYSTVNKALLNHPQKDWERLRLLVCLFMASDAITGPSLSMIVSTYGQKK